MIVSSSPIPIESWIWSVIGEDNGSFFILFLMCLIWLAEFYVFFNKKVFPPLDGRVTSPSGSEKLVGENNKIPSSFHQ
jgi:hypothetical protein